MDWRRFACQPDQRETGATLLGVVGIALVLSLLTASILSFTLQSAQSVLFNREHTQALYNARMGIDSAVELIDYELFTPSPPATNLQLVNLVNADLGSLSSPPFSASVSVESTTANTLRISSSGFFEGATVSLALDAQLPVSGSAFSQVSAKNASGFAGVSISGTGGAAISMSGNGLGTVSVNGSTATVSGFPNLREISSNGNVFVSPGDNASTWVKGSNNAVGFFKDAPSYRNLIVTGNNNWTFGDVKGTAIVSGNNVIVFGNIGGPLIVAGSGAVIYGKTHCALITGNNVTVTNNIKGNLVITGNDVNIFGNVEPGKSNPDVVITGNNVTIWGNVFGHLIATGTNEVVFGNITKGLTAIGPIGPNSPDGQNVTVYGRVHGGVSSFVPGPITIPTSCLGTVTLQFGAAGGGVTLIPSSSTVSG